jgi:hypothetical protein
MMLERAARVAIAGAVVLASATSGSAVDVVTHPYPGFTLIRRTEQMVNPTRQVKMNILVIDLAAPEVRFKMTPPTTGLPTPICVPPAPGVPWPCPSPEFEVVRQTTLQFLNDAHGQAAINAHFFAPFPVFAPSQAAYAYVIGLAASRGNVYSGFETPVQIYAIMPDSPAVNLDPDNHASIVHRDPADPTGRSVLESVTLWNALAGSGQIITSGVKTIPCYVPAPGCQLIGPGNNNYSNSNSWYNLVNARSAIGITADQKLVLFTVDVRPTTGAERSNGMRVGEVADVLLGLGVVDALNLDGGGSTTMALQDPADNVRKLINVPSDNPPRAEASSLAVYSDGIDPVATATATPAANAYGWSDTPVTLAFTATDERSGNTGPLPGWVDEVRYSLAGGPQVIVPGSSASVAVSAEGVTTVAYSATDAAGNAGAPQEATVRLDFTAPEATGLPADCVIWPPNHKMVQVAVVGATDALSGVPDGGLAVSASSSDPQHPNRPDVAVTPDGNGGFAVALRAERRGNSDGRTYTITATATDRAGNTSTASATCVVPHDQGAN